MTLETAMVEYTHGVLGDRLHTVITGDQISTGEPDLDCLTLLKTSDISLYNIHHKSYILSDIRKNCCYDYYGDDYYQASF